MKTPSLLPYPENITAPVEILIFLEQLFFLIHILLINSILGISIILLYKWGNTEDFFLINKLLSKKIPIFFALAINMAIPAFLFIQVVFGHLLYSSSILMGKYWIFVIPLLIIAYYSSYFHNKKFDKSPYARYALALVVLIVFYIAFMIVNNLTMMEMPERWSEYFTKRDGTVLPLNERSVYPRFLHFISASVAVGGILYSLYFKFTSSLEDKIKEGLKIFTYATTIQIIVGFWFLLSLPKETMFKFMGDDLLATTVMFLGITFTLLSVVLALKGKLIGTTILLLLTMVTMLINRYNLRIFRLQDSFSVYELKLLPQWDVFIIFLLILLIGLGILLYMFKVAFSKNKEVLK
ncbi:MAG: hypothetical protein N3A59_07960 [Thermodesulfovibrionales bacterium]|nr:hypothetical protein [Thermodesulfovibrionales bacterium]